VQYQWSNVAHELSRRDYTCGHCGKAVASQKGYYTNKQPQAFIYICPCDRPTYFSETGAQVPGIVPGNDVENLPDLIGKLYREARASVSVRAHTSSVLTSRKLLMHIAVAKGAPSGATFVAYVDYLLNNGHVPAGSRDWVDHIRQKGNEANHEINAMTIDDATELIAFLEMLLKLIYEFPQRVRRP